LLGARQHARRKFWEAALAKQAVAREALVRIGNIFELDERCRKHNPPSKLKEQRQRRVEPLLDEFLEFAATAYEGCKGERGTLRSALGDCVRQRAALAGFLEDGRLRMDNRRSSGFARDQWRARSARSMSPRAWACDGPR
jgi:transposase